MKWKSLSPNPWVRALVPLFLLFTVNPIFAQPVPENSVSICMAENHAIHWVAREILRDVYAEADLTPQFITYPNSRSLQVANQGGCMAEAGRIEQAGKRFQNLRVVKPEILTIRGFAYSVANPSITVTNWSDLKNYTVGIIRGELYTAAGASQAKNVIVVEDYIQLFSLLKRGRIDLAIGLHEPATQAILMAFEKKDFHRPDTALHEAKLFHFVHADHPRFAEALSPTLVKLHRLGGIKKLYAKAIQQLEINLVAKQ